MVGLSLPLVDMLMPPHQDDGRLRLQTASDADVQRVQEMQYFLKGPGDVITTVEMLAQRLQWGSIKGAALESLLRVMNKVYLPTFLSNATWPESTSGRCDEPSAHYTLRVELHCSCPTAAVAHLPTPNMPLAPTLRDRSANLSCGAFFDCVFPCVFVICQVSKKILLVNYTSSWRR